MDIDDRCIIKLLIVTDDTSNNDSDRIDTIDTIDIKLILYIDTISDIINTNITTNITTNNTDIIIDTKLILTDTYCYTL